MNSVVPRKSTYSKWRARAKVVRLIVQSINDTDSCELMGFVWMVSYAKHLS